MSTVIMKNSGIEVSVSGYNDVKEMLGFDLNSMYKGDVVYITDVNDEFLYRCEAENDRFNIIEMTSTLSEDIENCPFCGSHSHLEIDEDKSEGEYNTEVYVHCTTCGANGPTLTTKRVVLNDLDDVVLKSLEVVKMWNNANISSTLEKTVEKIKETTGGLKDKVEDKVDIDALKETIDEVKHNINKRADEVVGEIKTSLSDFFGNLSKKLKD